MNNNPVLSAIQAFIALLGTLLVFFLAFVVFSVGPIYVLNVSVLNCMQWHVCRVFVILPIVHMLSIFFAFGPMQKTSLFVGLLLIVLDTVMLFLSRNIIFGSEFTALMSVIGKGIFADLGVNANMTVSEIRMAVGPFMHGGIGYWLTLFCDIAFAAIGVLSMFMGGGKKANGYRSSSSNHQSSGMHF